MNSIKLKLIFIYVAVVFIIMSVSGTFILWDFRASEIDRSRDQLEAAALAIDTSIVQVYEPIDFLDAGTWAFVAQNEFEIQSVLLNDIGRPIAPIQFLGKSFTDEAVMEAVFGREGFSVGRIAPDLAGVEQQWISFAMPVTRDDNTFIVYTRMSARFMNEALARMTMTMVISMVISVLLIGILWFFLASTITNPIVSMTRLAKSMAQGNLTQKIQVNSKDEIGQLAYNFNHMAKELLLHLDNQKKLEEMRKEFVANVSHELRTPLTSIRTYAETLTDGAMEDTEMSVRFLKVIKDEAERMSELVTDLLELSRLDSGSLQAIELDVIELIGLLRKTVIQSQFLADTKNQKICFEPGIDSCFIEANASRISQVVSNILSNSIKYSPEHTKIYVSIAQTNTHYEVTIKDEGMGIPSDSLPHIFERFYRVDKARSRAMGGTGLGLAIAKEIMEEHGGSIEVSSELNSGVTMILRFVKYIGV